MPLMPYDQALEQLVQQLIPTIKTEYVPILQAQGRVLYENAKPKGHSVIGGGSSSTSSSHSNLEAKSVVCKRRE